MWEAGWQARDRDQAAADPPPKLANKSIVTWYRGAKLKRAGTNCFKGRENLRVGTAGELDVERRLAGAHRLQPAVGAICQLLAQDS